MNEEQLRRLSDCEVHINRYHDKLDEFLKQCDNYSKAVITKQEFQKQIEDYNARISRDFGMVRKDIISICQENNFLLKKLNLLEEEYANQLKNHQEAIENQKLHVEQLKNDNENSQSSHKSHLKDIADLNEKITNSDNLSKDLIKLKTSFLTFINETQNRHAFLDKQLNHLHNLHAEQRSVNDALNSNVSDFKKTVEDKFAIIEKKFEGHRLDTVSLMNSATSQIQQKLNNLPKTEPVILPNFNKMLEDQQIDTLQKVNIKSKGVDQALEQAKFNELQMIVLDKKLEKILVILSNNDLK